MTDEHEDTWPNGVPRIDDATRQRNLHDPAALRDLISSLFLYIGHYVETQLTTEQKELLHDVVEHQHPDIYSSHDEDGRRWWRQ